MRSPRLARLRATRLSRDAGGVTAEFAIVIPSVLLVLGVVVGGVMLSAQRITLVSAAGDIARLDARGDSALVGERLAALPVGVTIEREHRGSLTCVTLRSSPGRGVLSAIQLSAFGCAANSSDEFGQ